MKTKTQILNENIKDIIQRKEKGELDKDIAKIYNTSKSMIGSALRRHGYYSRKLINPEEIKDDVINEYVYNKLTIHHIAEKYNTSFDTVQKILKDNNIKIRPAYKTTYELNEKYFDIIDTGNKAYVLGLIASDGCVCKNTVRISLKYNDVDILEKVNKEVGSNRPLLYRDYSIIGENKYLCAPQYILSITNKYFANQLKNLGIVENKSLVLEFPTCITDDLLPDFLRGLFDGDGFLEKKRYRIGFTGTKQMMDSIIEKTKRILDIQFSIYDEHAKGGNTFSIKIGNKKDCLKFLNYIYNDSELYMNRKHDIYINYLNGLCRSNESAK